MSTKPRPANCTVAVNVPVELQEATRDRMVAGFKALGDHTRLEVFRLIAAQVDPICVCDIVDRFDVSQPTISHHLKILREAGLITMSRQGVWAHCAAQPRGLELLSQFFQQTPALQLVAR